jgi:antitoxin (DNA-binding transcriptional repressor) of toxin-antitoxin stability system
VLDKLTAGAVPTPLTIVVCVPALSMTAILAVLAPVPLGVKITLMVQLEPAATLVPQVFVCEKSLLLVPVTLMLVTLSAMLPSLASEIAWVPVEVPTGWFGKVRLAGDSAANAAVPVPLRFTFCVPTLSVRTNAAVLLPNVAGVNITLTAQLAPASRLVPQVFVSEKSPTLGPVREMEVNERGAVPVFCTVSPSGALEMLTGWFPKDMLDAERLTAGATAVPVKLMGCVPRLSVRTTDAFREPAAVGAKAMVIVQLAPSSKFVPQVFVWEKSLALAPLSSIDVIGNGAVPVFCTVTACDVLEVPTSWLAKVNAVVEKLMAGATPVPVRAMV